MELIASYFVEGTPAPQGSKTPIRRGNKIILIEGSGSGTQRHKDWRSAVSEYTATFMKASKVEEIDHIIRVELNFKIRKPKSRPRRMNAVDVRPDIDKLSRAVLDGMTSFQGKHLLLKDDSLVVELYADKYYCEPDEPSGVFISVYDISDKRLRGEPRPL